MTVLVLGGGQVANAVQLAAPLGCQVIARQRALLDIVDAAAVRAAVHDLKPRWIINAAAYTAVDLAEEQQAQAAAANDTAVGTLAAVAADAGSRLLHLSTDFVFDGKTSRPYGPDAQTNPLSIYGSTKRAGELHVLKTPPGIVIRTSWVYASSGKNFVLTMLRLMREKPHLSVVSDQIGSPTWATSLARAIWGLIAADAAPGMYHWTDLGVCSWYDFAVAIQDEALANGLLTHAVPILPIMSSQYLTKATRPAFSVLDTSAMRAAIDVPARHWRHHLRTMLDELRTA